MSTLIDELSIHGVLRSTAGVMPYRVQKLATSVREVPGDTAAGSAPRGTGSPRAEMAGRWRQPGDWLVCWLVLGHSSMTRTIHDCAGLGRREAERPVSGHATLQ
jgi:hypothetical protein